MTDIRMQYLFSELINHLSECNSNSTDFAMSLYGIGFNPIEIKELLYEYENDSFTLMDVFSKIKGLAITPTWANDYDVDYIHDGKYRVRKYGDDNHKMIEINDTMRIINDDEWYWIDEAMKAIEYDDAVCE